MLAVLEASKDFLQEARTSTDKKLSYNSICRKAPVCAKTYQT